jgi:hypothetical protein
MRVASGANDTRSARQGAGAAADLRRLRELHKVVEIGNPTSIDPADSSEELAVGAGTPGSRANAYRGSKRRLARASAYYTSQAYYKVAWWDCCGIQMNYVRSILNWTWGNGGCIVGSVASSAVWRNPGTGWYNSAWNWWKTTSCTDHRTHTDADLTNSLFCVPPSTYTHYRNVRIRGGYTGTYGAALDSTWTDGTQCFPGLHWVGTVVKEY